MKRKRQTPDRHAKRRRWLRSAAAAVLLGAAGWAVAWYALPFPGDKLADYPASLVLLDREGRPLRVRLGPGDLDCRPVYRPSPDDWIAKAMVAAEDSRFWSHPGVDPIALLRATGQNVLHGRVVSGASTLSTQVIRLLEPRPRTLSTKVVEAFRALQLERMLSKDAILEQYLNRAPFGGNIVGIEAASLRYFGKRARDLSLGEAALLAGLPQSPARLRPDRHPERAAARRAYVLGRMAACGYIDAGQRDEAARQPVAVRPAPYPFRAPHYADFAARNLPADAAGSPMVRTTLDPALQRAAEDALRRHVDTLRARGVHGGAVVILDVRTGALRALAGSPDYADTRHAGQVNGAAAPRSAGSTLKPFLFAMALDQGRISPDRVLADVPRAYRDYAPANFDGAYRGLVTARDALVLSLNIPALDLLAELGTDPFLHRLRSLGLDTLAAPAATYGVGLALGNGAVRLVDLANAYACLARGGVYRPWRLIEDAAAPETGVRLFSEEAAWLVADMLSGDERAMDATGHRADVPLPRLAWKTGTSSGFRDAWALAFNPDYVIGIWLGNPDGSPAGGLTGADGAVPLAWDLFRALYPSNDGPWFARPEGLARRAVCTVSGQPAGRWCPHRTEDWFIAGVSRSTPCAVHAHGPDSAGRMAAVWPPDIERFLQTQRADTSAGPAASSALRILSPAPDDRFRVIDGLRGAAQQLQLSAAAPAHTELFWFVDDQCVGSAPAAQAVRWPMARGPHRIVCADAAGRSAIVHITVD